MEHEELVKNVRAFAMALEKECYNCSNTAVFRLESKFRKLNLHKV